jgi:serine/threonine protein kinase
MKEVYNVCEYIHLLIIKESNSILKEAQILKELDHKNIVKYYDVLKTSDGIYIFLEYVSKVLALITEYFGIR